MYSSDNTALLTLLLPFLMFSDYHDPEMVTFGGSRCYLEVLMMAKLNTLILTETHFVESHKVDLEVYKVT